ncbi:MAG: peroxiredoxin [Planctomycetota bacterium]|jgi:peroxiredoxin
MPSSELRERFLELDGKWRAVTEKLRASRTQGARREAAHARLRDSMADDFRTNLLFGCDRSAVWLLATESLEKRMSTEALPGRLVLYRRALELADHKWLARSQFINTLVGDAELALGFAGARTILDQLEARATDFEVQGSVLLGRARLAVREAADEIDMVRAANLHAEATRLLSQLVTDFPGTPSAQRGEFDLWRLHEMLPGRDAPELVSTDIDGNEYSLEDMQGQVVLLHFFSFDHWGVHHRMERDAHFVERYWDENFVLFGVNCDTDKSVFRRRCDKAEIEWPILWDGNNDVTTAQAWHLPGESTVLIDRQGKIVAVDPSPARLQAFLDVLVRDNSAGGGTTPSKSVGLEEADGKQTKDNDKKSRTRSSG